MVSFAYAATRSSFVEPESALARMAQGATLRPVKPVSTGGFDLARRLMLAMITLTALGLIGWVAAELMDSLLLGFVFADLVFLVGIALRGAIIPQRRSRAR
ncbi:MAG TPA: hypothetical protein VKQ09_00210 [Sphingomonas sp.]|nr:hypothetical protein [Sphingomonas sp.]